MRAANAVDRNLMSLWHSRTRSSNQWLRVDLGARVDVFVVTIVGRCDSELDGTEEDEDGTKQPKAPSRGTGDTLLFSLLMYSSDHFK